tara:strand:+ start:3598 stop:4455 length:858 start_codon:yes stop_codon:yes gene_type:complete
MDFINKDLKITKYSNPFPYLIIEDFLNPEFYKEIEKNFPLVKELENKKNLVRRMNFDTTYGDQVYDNYCNRSKEFKIFHDWVYSLNFLNFFTNLFIKDLENEYEKKFLSIDINTIQKKDIIFEKGAVFNNKNLGNKSSKDIFIFPRLDIGVGVKNYGIDTGGRGPHIDNPQRLISILFYCGGYKSIKGGQHRIFSKNKIMNDLEVEKIIEPAGNKLIASIQNNIAFHDVDPVLEIDGQRNAFYMAISGNTKLWKKPKRNKINKEYNKNRYQKNLLDIILNKFIKT